MTRTEQIKALILEREAEGRVVYYQSPTELVSSVLSELCKQPADGLLYDLNRDESTILTLASDNDPYWVNNYATAKVIRHLKARIESLEEELKLEKEKVSILNERLDEAVRRIKQYEEPMQFNEYQHIERFGMPEVEFIEQGKCYIFPKIDGTNASVWMGDDGEIHAGSRHRELTLKKRQRRVLCLYPRTQGYTKTIGRQPTHTYFRRMARAPFPRNLSRGLLEALLRIRCGGSDARREHQLSAISRLPMDS